MSALILTLIGIATALFCFLHHKLSYWKRRGVASVKASYFLGNLDGVGEKIHFTTNLQTIYETFKDNHKYCGFYMLPTPRLMLIDLDIIKNVLIKDFHHFADRGIFHNEEDDPLSGHLFALEGEKWKNLRHKLSVTFTSGRMRMMFPIIEAYSNQLVDLVEGLSNNPMGIDIKNVCLRFTADVIGSCGFGIECNAMRDENSEMLRMAEFFDIKDPLTRIKFFIVNIFIDFSKKFRLKVTPKFINDFFLSMIKQTFEYREKSDLNRSDFLSLLMQIKKYGKLKDEEMENVGSLTFNELAAQAFIFFVAGKLIE
jgi:cytochrome P450 family 6